jgi:amino acid permease
MLASERSLVYRVPARPALTRRLGSRSSFWTAFALTLTETVGAGILALPVALAEVGPLPSLAILIALGIINVLTIAAMAEAVARSASIRQGGFLGQVVNEYLGRVGSLILSLGSTIINCLTLWVCYVGFSTTLADATRIPAPVWAGLLFVIGLLFVRRKSLSAASASAQVVSVINVSLILILSLLALAHQKPAYLLCTNMPLCGGRPFEPSVLRLVFGVVMVAYFGHMSLGYCAREVLGRDPSARSFIWGVVAAQVVVAALYCLWTFAVNAAVGPRALIGYSGTALAPLAAEIGPAVHVLGSVFVVLGMGMGSVHSSLAVFNLVHERLPASSHASTQTSAGPLGVPVRWVRRILRGTRAQVLLSVTPLVALFLLVERVLVTGKESFAEPLSFLGVIVISLLGGIFPMLLLLASRCKGSYVPHVALRMLGRPVVAGGIYVLYLAALFLHGLVIWEHPLHRLAALATGVMALSLTVALARRQTFARRPARKVERYSSLRGGSQA